MKKNLISMLKVIGSLLHLIVNLRWTNGLNYYWRFVYSSWLSKEFSKNTSFCYFEGMVKIKGAKYIKIGEKCKIGKMSVLAAWDKFGNTVFSPTIQIGNNVNLGEFNHITAINEIRIGNNVLSGRFVTITDNAHGDTTLRSLSVSPEERPLFSKGRVLIGDNVWIGDKVTILPNVSIGDGVVIGANSVVTRDIPSFSVCVGNPAKIIKINK